LGARCLTALADFQLEMDDAQKSGKVTLDQLTTARDKLFNETQAPSVEIASRVVGRGRFTTPHCNLGGAATNLPVGWARLDDEGSV
jgi:hypothetical protein